MLEAVGYRFKGHSVVDPAKYRTTEDVENAREHDPIVAVAQQLAGGGRRSTEESAKAVEAEVDAESVAAAVEFADASPHPDPSSLFDYTYATPVPATRRLPADPLFR